ncbi:MAG TPA: hypothetical protein PKL15_18330, partial [Saprospiraceae bacterium]|nr:hypothetical protein [Saprospiraceae bacterium]
MRTSFFLLLPLFLLASCAPYYRYQPAAEQPDLTTTYYHHGLPTLRRAQFGIASEVAHDHHLVHRSCHLNLHRFSGLRRG